MRSSWMLGLVLTGALAVVSGCDDDDEDMDASARHDAAVMHDAGMRDAGMRDASTADAGTDAGGDAGAADAGADGAVDAGT